MVWRCGHHAAAVFTRSGTEIQNAIRSRHHFRIMLNNKDRVSQITQLVQDVDQAFGISAMQADGGLV